MSIDYLSIKRVAQDIVSTRACIALTGAGISTASGIPPFRGKGGLWEKYDPDEYVTISAFYSNPEKVWTMLRELLEILRRASPNPAHYALAELERLGYLRAVVTQNVDGLHQAAGSMNVIEFHGNNETLVCLKCGKRYPTRDVSVDVIPPRCECGFPLKPDAVFFGEAIPENALWGSFREARNCDVVLVVGTSGVVEPAASIPRIARQHGAKIVEVNPEQSMISPDLFICGNAEIILPEIVKEVRLICADS